MVEREREEMAEGKGWRQAAERPGATKTELWLPGLVTWKGLVTLARAVSEWVATESVEAC